MFWDSIGISVLDQAVLLEIEPAHKMTDEVVEACEEPARCELQRSRHAGRAGAPKSSYAALCKTLTLSFLELQSAGFRWALS